MVKVGILDVIHPRHLQGTFAFHLKQPAVPLRMNIDEMRAQPK